MPVRRATFALQFQSMNLNQVTVPVRDVAASILFYQKLGLRLIVSNLPSYARLECPDGDATFSLHQSDRLPEGEGVWIYFEDSDLDTVIQDLLSHGVAIETMPEDKPWLWREARLKDPDGHQIILYYAGDNRKNPPWRL